MKLQTLVPVIFIALVLCGADKPTQSYFERFKGIFGGTTTKIKRETDVYRTDLSNYRIVDNTMKVGLSNGLYGIIKVFSEQEIKGVSPKGKSVAAYTRWQGAGSVVVLDGCMFIVTVRHNIASRTDIRVIEEIDLKGKKKTIEFEKIDQIGAKVLVGSLGVIPENIWFSRQYDISVLQIAPKDQKSVLDVYSRDSGAPINITSPSNNVRSGIEVESWGFPARQDPQVEKLMVASVDSEYFVLNRALLRGYSGGLVLVKTGKTKSIGGVIFRADDQANQTAVLPWSIVSSILQAAKSNKVSPDIEKVELGNAVSIGDVTYRFNQFYDETN